MTVGERAAEQDTAAGGRELRVVELDTGRLVLASVYLRLPPKSRRVYAYMRWSEGRKTHERYICQVSAGTRAENLATAWQTIHINAKPVKKRTVSWAHSPATRVIMSSNRPRDTKPEIALRSAVHSRGLRYKVAAKPVPGLRRSADLVFAGPRVAVYLDGCFWHGCPDHYRASTRNNEFWTKKVEATRERDRQTTDLLAAAGWTVVRVWEHEDPAEAADRVEAAVFGRSHVVEGSSSA
ncbi:MAG TPA: very short patch repair endonuclease [Micromonosporaceae bacterium]|jgi:DNA mismatch endonuclease (patch repair protein)|nr:very short patch repair endonuclease [Micromonosporaceae bacterium]